MIKQYRKQKGFTLMEVAAVVAISGTLAAMSVPMVKQYQGSYSIDSVKDAFVRDVNMARETAVSRAANIVICPSQDGVSCSDSWATGWIVYQGSESSNIAEDNIIAKTMFEQSIPLSIFNEYPQQVNQLQFDQNGYNRSASRLTATFCTGTDAIDTVTLERSGRLIDNSTNQGFKETFLKNLAKAKIQLDVQCKQA